MKISFTKNLIAVLAVIAAIIGTGWAVRHYHQPGQLDVISAQAMDMTLMRPPTGAAPVALADARHGSLEESVTYTASVAAYNEQEISPRITGTLTSLRVYPGDRVRAGQVVAQLDTSQVGPQAAQAAAQAREAMLGARVAHLTHYLHHQAGLAQANAGVLAAQQGIAGAQADARASQDAIADARAAVQSAHASTDYWNTEIVREKQLADAGAASRQEYQNELSQAQQAQAALAQARAKVNQATAAAQSAQAKVTGAQRQADVARAGVKIAQADIAVAGGQAAQAEAGAEAAQAAAQAAAVQRGYSRILSPANGIVTARPASPGMLVQAGTIILRVAEVDRVRVQANVGVEDLAGVHVGSPLQIAMRGGGSAQSIPARVTSVFPSADPQTRTAVVEAVVSNLNHRLLPGAFATVRIFRDGVANRLLVPASALAAQGGVSYLWTANGSTQKISVYECVVCHMHYTSAQAAKLHYRDPMDGGKLVPVPGTVAASGGAGLTAHRVVVQVGASDGTWTEITGSLPAGARVVTHGQAGLSEGARVVATAWGADGPQTLPVAASDGEARYKCEKCGMTYSAADAKRNHYIDPMDGGRLVRVEHP